MKILDVEEQQDGAKYSITILYPPSEGSLGDSMYTYEVDMLDNNPQNYWRNSLLAEFCRMYISNNSIKDNIRSTALDLFEIGAITEDKFMELIKDE